MARTIPNLVYKLNSNQIGEKLIFNLKTGLNLRVPYRSVDVCGLWHPHTCRIGVYHAPNWNGCGFF